MRRGLGGPHQAEDHTVRDALARRRPTGSVSGRVDGRTGGGGGEWSQCESVSGVSRGLGI